MKVTFNALGSVNLPDFFIVGAPQGRYDILTLLPSGTPANFHAQRKGTLVFQLYG